MFSILLPTSQSHMRYSYVLVYTSFQLYFLIGISDDDSIYYVFDCAYAYSGNIKESTSTTNWVEPHAKYPLQMQTQWIWQSKVICGARSYNFFFLSILNRTIERKLINWKKRREKKKQIHAFKCNRILVYLEHGNLVCAYFFCVWSMFYQSNLALFGPNIKRIEIDTAA